VLIGRNIAWRREANGAGKALPDGLFRESGLGFICPRGAPA